MDRNLILAFALSMAVFSGWLAWQEQVRGPERRAAAERARVLAASEEAETGFAEEAPSVRERERVRIDTDRETLPDSAADPAMGGMGAPRCPYHGRSVTRRGRSDRYD